MGQTNYKNEIELSRIGSLGSSDAALVERVGRGGIAALTDTDKYRLAVLKGQAEKTDFHSRAMELGDAIEQTLFGIISKKFPQAKSNPLHEDELMSKYYGFHIINHIDVEVEEEQRVVWYEIKASKYDTVDVLNTYKAQLQWHWMMLKKIYGKSGKDISVQLVHYKTGVTENFQSSNITITPVKCDNDMESTFYDGLINLKEYLPTFEYVAPEEMSIRLVSDEHVQALRERAEEAIPMIAQLQQYIDDFKKALCDYMMTNGIKKIYSDEYTITLTLPTTTTSFDSKAFKADNPDLYKQYSKTSERAASVTIRTK